MTVAETQTEDDEVELLGCDNIGRETDLPTNYSVDRVEEVTVPGPVVAEDAVPVLPAPPGVAPVKDRK